MVKQRPHLTMIVPLVTMFVFPLLGILYSLVNGPRKEVYSLATNLDAAIPFVKAFALPYSIWIFYIYICLVYFYFKDQTVYFRTLTTYIICAFVCYSIYMVFQTTVSRPVLVGDDLLTRLLAFIYGRDEPYNCFPSIHSFSSYLMMKALFKSRFRNMWNQILIYGMSTTIILSTLFVKQHVILDVIGAVVLVEAVYALIQRFQWAARLAFDASVSEKA
ncbi:MAG TPA: phosphatase PAP2 family protein [Bacilli bacterium]